MKLHIRVGIPRALSYFTFYPLWKVFFETLGFEVVLSGPTNRKILEWGIRETVNDACIPIKVYHGHVLDLAEKVDFIFVPRMISADGKATFCPKFLGLPDMVRYSGADLPTLIDIRYDLGGLPGGMLRFFKSAAAAVGIDNPFRVLYAAIRALIAQRKYQGLLLSGLRPVDALDKLLDENRPGSSAPVEPVKDRGHKSKGVAVALLGYPYAIFDPYISAGIYQKLINLGVDVVTFEEIPLRHMRRFSKKMPQNFFWYYSNQVCWAGLYLLDQKQSVDGFIHVTAFGCGPDAMVDKTLELESKSAGMPFLSLTIDEHTGEGGVQTRLEAFVDMLKIRKNRNRAG